MKGWDLEAFKQSEAAKRPENAHILEPVKKKSSRSKMHNEKTYWNDMVFDSKREYRRYRELLLLVKAGEITLPRRQVPYELNEGGTHSYKYIADFVYQNQKTGETIVEDSKGYQTAVYKKKRKLMKKLFGIIILET